MLGSYESACITSVVTVIILIFAWLTEHSPTDQLAVS